MTDISDIKWFCQKVDALTDDKITLRVSQWAAEDRYLTDELTSNPGYWDNNYTPYLTEIMDNFSSNFPIREVCVRKAVQVGLTTGVLENTLGYKIKHAPAPIMYITADEGLAKNSVEIKVDRMIMSCDLADLIRSPDSKSRKTGNTSVRKDFPGGFLLSYGARSAAKLRSMSVETIFFDEVDGMPFGLKDEGSPIRLAMNRQKGYEDRRKTLFLSTPLILQNSVINHLFLLGDQRYYFVPCKHCGKAQIMRFKSTREDGQVYGLRFKVIKGILDIDSVEYVCEFCFKTWKNYDKDDFLPKGEWRPTAEARRRLLRSYHVDALLSPIGMFSWEGIIEEWLDCWDVEKDRVKDVDSLQTFYNTVLALPWEERGEAPRYEKVIQHRRTVYSRNQIPNKIALQETGSPILLLTAGVDIHKNRIDIEIVGWCTGARSYSVDWRSLDGDTDDLQGPAWGALRKIIETESWTADDGKRYQVALTLIDASYRTGTVYDFAGEYSTGVIAIQGRDASVKSAAMRQFSEYEKAGIIAYNVTVTLYKDRLAGWLRRDWNEGKRQPIGYPNYPVDYGDDFFRQYESETKKEKLHPTTRQRLGFYWEKLPNKDNHAWDCRIYGMAALDMIVYNINLLELRQDRIDYDAFWPYIQTNKTFFN